MKDDIYYDMKPNNVCTLAADNQGWEFVVVGGIRTQSESEEENFYFIIFSLVFLNIIIIISTNLPIHQLRLIIHQS